MVARFQSGLSKDQDSVSVGGLGVFSGVSGVADMGYDDRDEGGVWRGGRWLVVGKK